MVFRRRWAPTLTRWSVMRFAARWRRRATTARRRRSFWASRFGNCAIGCRGSASSDRRWRRLAGEVHRVESPNFDARPPGSSIELIVVHNISLPPGCYGGGHIGQPVHQYARPSRDEFFFAQIASVRVSAHMLIERDGKMTQFVSFNRPRLARRSVSFGAAARAATIFRWASSLREPISNRSPTCNTEPLNAVIAALQTAYPIRAVRGHTDIAPGRKTDPGPYFDWRRVEFASGVPYSDLIPALNFSRNIALCIFDAMRHQLLLSFENSAHMMRHYS